MFVTTRKISFPSICCIRRNIHSNNNNNPISFSQVREDPNIEIIIRKEIPIKKISCMVIASGGCTIFSLLTNPTIRQIDAYDINQSQIHLISLRKAAIIHLSLKDHLFFIGSFRDDIDSKNGNEQERIKIYNKKLRSHLLEPCAKFWDDNIKLISMGINRSGKFEELFRELSHELNNHNIIDNSSMIIKDKTACNSASPVWKKIFDKVFERQKLAQLFGEASVAYSMDRSFSDHFSAVFSDAIQKWDPKDNYFLNQVLFDQYPSINNLPPYLSEEKYNFLKDRLISDNMCLQLRLNDFWKLQTYERKYELVHTSNISDWMPISSLIDILKMIKLNILTKDGCLIMRRLNGDHNLEKIVPMFYKLDTDFNKKLKDMDRSFFYSEVVVGRT